MNEKIEELAKKAVKEVEYELRKADSTKWFAELPMNQEKLEKFQRKFAELVIMECARVANENILAVIDSQVGNTIKQHFGIK
jgi:hypothetical protein